MNKELIEIVARGAASSDGFDPDSQILGIPRWKNGPYLYAAITALSSLEAAGYKINRIEDPDDRI